MCKLIAGDIKKFSAKKDVGVVDKQGGGDQIKKLRYLRLLWTPPYCAYHRYYI